MTRRTSGRDLIDGMVDARQREMPDLDRPGYELARRAVRLGVLLEDALAPVLASRNLTKSDYGVLSALRLVGAPYELRPSDLKTRLLLTSGGVTTVLKRLEKAGLIEREQDTTDGRSSWVRLTNTGIETAGATMQAWSEAESHFFQAVPPELRQAASDTLHEVLLAIGDLEPPTPQTKKRRERSSQKTLMAL
ncbi:MarR family winged helix-turn-helix transcriptional regulator [Actinacidiphila oryziradicis]|nr:MarR family transcriptional regulator [Actinacidiphila oryziradicis]